MSLGMLGVAVPAHAAEVAPVNEGDLLTFGEHYCTVGYIDAAERTAITAAHCADDGVRVGYVAANGYTDADAGTLYHAKNYTPTTSVNDYAVIVWDDDVPMGNNIYSGDKRLTAAEVGGGDTICYQGQISHGFSGEYTCGAYRDRLGNNVYYFVNPGVGYGDSGGPTWIPGKGFLGVTSSSLALPTDPDLTNTVEITTIPSQGPVYNALINSVVGTQALSAKTSSDNPYDAANEQLSSRRVGEAISDTMDQGSSYHQFADRTADEQTAIWVTLGVATGLTVVLSTIAAVVEFVPGTREHVERAIELIRSKVPHVGLR